jgi:anthranilate synthase component 2
MWSRDGLQTRARRRRAVVDGARACQILPVIVVVDNRDSFTWNLVHAIARFAPEVCVVEGDTTSAEEVLQLTPRAVVLSPGPGRPEQARVCMDLVRAAPATLPLLGICLGHQVLCVALGAKVAHASEPVHGRTSAIAHTNAGLFAGLPQGFRAARYHSLHIETSTLPACLEAVATAEDGTLMAVQHRAKPWCSLQFHPESFMTEHGLELVRRFVALLPLRHSRGSAL